MRTLLLCVTMVFACNSYAAPSLQCHLNLVTATKTEGEQVSIIKPDDSVKLSVILFEEQRLIQVDMDSKRNGVGVNYSPITALFTPIAVKAVWDDNIIVMNPKLLNMPPPKSSLHKLNLNRISGQAKLTQLLLDPKKGDRHEIDYQGKCALIKKPKRLF